MAKKRNRDNRQKGGYQIGFQESDLEWLAEQFQKQAAQNPNLTLEEFVIRYGVQPEWLNRYMNPSRNADKGKALSIGGAAKHFGVRPKVIREWMSSGHLNAESIQGDWRIYLRPGDPLDASDGAVNLWHGTTEDRARAIREKGFRVQGAPMRRGIWFSLRPNLARSVARSRGQQRGEIPVVISCEIDLGKYTKFSRPSLHVYVFYSPVGVEVVHDISVLEKHRASKAEPRSIDVVVTKASGKLGVLSWINAYLSLQDEATVTEDHPAVEAVHQWVQTEYADGRDEPISDEEMLMLAMPHFK